MTLPGSRRKLSAVGNYRLTGNTLGRGNFARVEEAVHTLLQVKVAVKVMDINQIKEEYVIKNLCREAKIMSKLNHPCIVALFQTMQRSDNVYYLVTELVSGGDLCSFVKGQHNGKLEERSTRMYARQFASALSHMHGLGVVHRDLKMENVMLNSSQSQIKIVDFGLSNSWSADNPLRTHCGSPEYAAPELFITGKQYGAEVDLWSLGIILYGMVMGQLPFMTSRASASTSQQRRKRLVAQINAGLATPHRRALAPFTPEFRSLMGRLLVADASRRIDARELTAHPWITERGRKVVRSNPLKEIDSSWRSKMIIEISTILQIDKKLVLSALSQDPLGKIGGMFNILQRKYQMSQLHGDGVTRSVPSVTLLELSDMTKGLGKGKAISTARTPAQKKPHTAAVGRRMDYFCTPRMVELDKHIRQVLSSPNEQVMRSKTSRTRPKPSDHHHHHHPAVAAPKQRPSTVQPTSSSPSPAAPRSRRCPPPDYRTLQSPSLRRKAYSAAVSSKAGGAASPPPPPRARDLAPAHQGAGDVALRGVAGGERCRHPRHATPSSPDDPQRRSSRPPPDRPRRRPGQSPGRPSSGPLQQLLERSLRTAGRDRPTAAAPPTPILSASFRAATCATPAEGQRRGGHEAAQAQSRRRGDGWDVPTARAVTVPYPTGRKSAIYDPIARSIADYVVNNVPHKLSNVPWRKK